MINALDIDRVLKNYSISSKLRWPRFSEKRIFVKPKEITIIVMILESQLEPLLGYLKPYSLILHIYVIRTIYNCVYIV